MIAELSANEAISLVPRLSAWSFLRLIHRGVLPPPHCLPLYGAGDLRFPPLINREKNSGLPPVTQEKPSLAVTI